VTLLTLAGATSTVAVWFLFFHVGTAETACDNAIAARLQISGLKAISHRKSTTPEGSQIIDAQFTFRAGDHDSATNFYTCLVIRHPDGSLSVDKVEPTQAR
jgi:hypothetical protein